MSADCARSSISWPLDSAESQMRARSRSVARIALGLTYRWCASSSPNAAHTSLQWSLQHRLELLLGGHHQLGVLAHRSSSAPKRSTGSSSAMSGRSRSSPSPAGENAPVLGRDLGELAVLERELRRRRDLDLLDIAQRALRERREPAQRLDLDVEHVDPHGPLLGRREHVQQPAAQRELAALLDLVDALVARAHELRGALVEVEQLADAQRERVRAQLAGRAPSPTAPPR